MLISLLVLTAGPQALAQYYDGDEGPVSNGIGIGAEIALPTGDFNDVADPGLGITLGFTYGWRPQVDFMGMLGYIMWGGKDSQLDFSAIPIQAGAKYFFSTAPSRLYVGGLFGFHFFKVETEFVNPGGQIVKDSDRETKFSLAPMIGYEFPLSESFVLDASARYQFVSGDFSYLSLRAAVEYPF